MLTYDRAADTVFPGDTVRSGVMGQMSFSRLCEALENTDEVREGERITHIVVNGDVLQIYYERKCG